MEIRFGLNQENFLKNFCKVFGFLFTAQQQALGVESHKNEWFSR